MANSSVRLLSNTTSTGFGLPVSIEPSRLFTNVISTIAGATGTGSYRVQGSIDGENWADLLSASTYTITRSLNSTSTALVTNLRAELATHVTGAAVNIFVASE